MSAPAFASMTGKQLDRRITEILDAREAEDKPLTIEHLAYELGVDKHTLARYRQHAEPRGDTAGGRTQGVESHAYDEHCAAIKRGYARCEGWLADQLHSGRTPVGAIFALKCGYRWREEPTRIDLQGGFLLPVDTSAADD